MNDTRKTLSDDEQRVLQQLLCGDLDPDSREAQELLSAHPSIRNTMLAFESTAHNLSRLSADASDVVAEAREAVTDRDRELIRGALPSSMASGSGRWKLLAGGLLAAAAAVLILARPALWPGTAEQAGPVVTGPLSSGAIHPVGAVTGSYAPFEIGLKLEAGQSLRIRVFDRSSTEVASSVVSTSVWEPEAEVAAAIEQLSSITWMYSVEDGSVSTGAKGTVRASKAD